MSASATSSSLRTATVLVVVLRLIAVIDVGYAAVRAGRAATSRLLPLTTQVSADSEVRLDVPGLSSGTRAHLLDHTLSLSLTGQGVGLKLLAALPDVVGALGVTTGALLLAALVRDIGCGEVFTRRSVTCTNLLAATVPLTGLLVPVVHDAIATVILDHNGLLDRGLPFVPSIQLTFTPVVLALLLTLLATTWHHGARMRDDLEGLV